MSSFIVDDSTINNILAYVEFDTNNPRSYHQVRNLLEQSGYRVTPEGLRGLAHEMHRLNVYACDARYGDGQGLEMCGEPFQYKRMMTPGAIVAVKSLQCLLYQCAEGDIPERPLYKTLRELECVILDSIVSRLPEYEKAAWG